MVFTSVTNKELVDLMGQHKFELVDEPYAHSETIENIATLNNCDGPEPGSAAAAIAWSRPGSCFAWGRQGSCFAWGRYTMAGAP
ncbi:UNVERIFIED_CONTAM: hypothetical protein FKN15_058005 [Acipenser sinensis]